MTFTRALRTVVPVTALAATLLVVASGCSSLTGTTASPKASAVAVPTSPATSSAAKKAACTLLGSSLQDLGTNAQTAYSEFAKDPQSAATALSKAAGQFTAGVATITDPGAQALAKQAEAHLATLVAEAQNAVAHPVTGAAAVAKGVQTLQGDITKIGTYCS
ncbi:MAG: hypothetical protein JWP75_3399 [Frondihabitans sp.]|nr:hypothetical protein [Frondihabitans sp.]